MTRVEDITLTKQIGKGAFGEVYLTSREGTNKYFATKKVAKSKIVQEKVKQYFNNEIFVLEHVNHPNIIKLHEIKKTFNNFYLIFDFCNGGGLSNCLDKYMAKYQKPFSQEIVQYIMKQITSGLQYIHNKKILHRDLKLDNILVEFNNDKDIEELNMLNCTIKIIDFGFSRYLEADSLAQSVLGSPIYMDPQILKKMRKIENNQAFGYDEKADIWSLGTICYELLIGSSPFDANGYDDLVEKIQLGNYKIPHHLKLSKECVSFLNAQLQYDPKERLNINELVAHVFLNKPCSEFQAIDLYKAEEKFKKSNEIIMNTKRNNKSIWDAFDQKNVNLKDINSEMIDKTKAKQFIPVKGLEKSQIDIIGELMNQTDKINIQQEQALNQNNINYINDNNNSKKQFDQNSKDEVMRIFDELNKDFCYVEPMLIPIIPDTDSKILQLDI